MYEHIDDILRTLYECMSFSAGDKPDYLRFQTLFAPGANVLPPSDDEIKVSAVSVDEFVATSSQTLEKSRRLLESGFTEKELCRQVHQFETVAQIFSTYESHVVFEGESHTSRGINCLQLIWQSSRWWIVSLVWDDETPTQRVPVAYLPEA